MEVGLEKRIHNGYVTGGFDLARRYDAQYVVNASGPVAFDRVGLRDGEELTACDPHMLVIATPGRYRKPPCLHPDRRCSTR